MNSSTCGLAAEQLIKDLCGRRVFLSRYDWFHPFHPRTDCPFMMPDKEYLPEALGVRGRGSSEL